MRNNKLINNKELINVFLQRPKTLFISSLLLIHYLNEKPFIK